MNSVTVTITRDKLEDLRMLADWQLRELGFCPESVAAACRQVDEANDAEWLKRFVADRSQRK